MKRIYQTLKASPLGSRLMRSCDVVVKRRLPEHGHPMFVRLLSNHWVTSDYESEIRDVFRSVCRDRSLRYLYDIGANVGIFSLDFLALDPANRVVSFEPNPRVLQCLRRTAELNELRNMEVVDVALSDRSGTAALTFDPMSPAKGGLHPIRDGMYNHELEYGGVSTSVEIRTETLDGWVEHHAPPDVIKMDAEGEELAILRGGEQLFRRHRPVLFFECTKERSEVASLLASYGYDLVNVRLEPIGELDDFSIALPRAA